jgi:LPS-assembly protein
MWGLVLVALFSFAQQAANDGQVTADQIEGEGQTVAHYKGNVVAKYRDMQFEADFADYDKSTQQLTAGEHVRFTRPMENLQGSSLDFNMGTKSGIVTNAHGQIGGFNVTAAKAERLEDGRWHLYNATLTSCDDTMPHWTFNTPSIVIDPDKHFTAKNTVFRFMKRPVFYLPYISAPSINRERQTGFLIPSTSTSTTKGRSLRVPFYWAINRSMDAMFIPEYFSSRGPAGIADFRAVPNDKTRIDVNTLFAIDKLHQGGESARIIANTSWGDGYRAVADIDAFTSLTFREVYDEGFSVISSPLQLSSAFLTNNQTRYSYNFVNSRNAIFFQDQPTAVLQKLPAVEFSLPENAVASGLPVYFTMDGGLAGIARRDSAINTPMTGRLDFHPSLDIPVIRSDAFNWSHRLDLEETYYSDSVQPSNAQQSLNRSILGYQTSFTGPRFERSFGKWSHIIEPSIDYRYITGANEFRNTIVVDNVDLRTNTNEIEYAITNRFISSYEFLSWRLAQKMYFDPTFGGAILPGHRNVFEPVLDITGFAFADGPRRVSPLVSTMRISTTPSTVTDIEFNYDTNQKQFQTAGIVGEYNRGQVHSSLSYFFTKRSTFESPHDQVGGLIQYGNRLRKGLSVATGFNYDIHNRLFQGSTTQVYYNKDCYGVSAEFSQVAVGSVHESRVRFSLMLKNLGTFGTLRRQERVF